MINWTIMIINSTDGIFEGLKKGTVQYIDTKTNEFIDLSDFVKKVETALTPAQTNDLCGLTHKQNCHKKRGGT